MKKILLSFSFIFALCVASFAQTVTITGMVSDANGNPMSNYPVYIASDSSAIGTVYFNTVFTNASGVFTDPNGTIQGSQGAYHASVTDSCTGAVHVQTGYYSPANLTVGNLNFTICANTPPSCLATLTSTVQDSIVTFNATSSGGTAPYAYAWDFGDGMVLTNVGNSYTHLYAANGTYNACIIVTDATGCVATTCNTVVINSYSGSGNSCSASYTYNFGVVAPDVFFSGQATGQAPFSYAWDFGDGATSATQNPIHSYAQTGVYMPCLTITDASGCISTYCDSLYAQGANSNCNVTVNASVNNTTASFTATTTGTAPFTYLWDMGDSTTSTVANPTHTYSGQGVYVACVTVTDATGCVSTDCFPVTLTVPVTSGTLSGFVATDTVLWGNSIAEVYLIEYDSITGTLTAIDTTVTVQGFYSFTNVPFGNYYVKGALLSSDPQYANYLPTYFITSLYWNTATSLTLSPNASQAFAPIELIQGTNATGGPGFIGGLVTQGANGPGDPMEGVEVILFDANMNPIGYTYTDEDGNYSFADLAMGVYYIYIESLGLQAAPVQVTLSNSTTSMTEVNFEVGSTYAMFTNTEDIQSISGVSVFPNPVLNNLNLQVQADKTLDATISVVTLTGQVLVSEAHTFENGFNNVSIMSSDLATGIYMVRVQTNEGVVTQKFVKQ
ncbi:MAG: PKD domain-containing protein [Saprospiraceae bacterium]